MRVFVAGAPALVSIVLRGFRTRVVISFVVRPQLSEHQARASIAIGTMASKRIAVFQLAVVARCLELDWIRRHRYLMALHWPRDILILLSPAECLFGLCTGATAPRVIPLHDIEGRATRGRKRQRQTKIEEYCVKRAA